MNAEDKKRFIEKWKGLADSFAVARRRLIKFARCVRKAERTEYQATSKLQIRNKGEGLNND